MSERSSKLKNRLRQGETTFGAWLTVANSMVAEIMAGAGFDWVLIDTEHGGFSNEGVQTCLVAFNGSPTVPMVRVAWNDAVLIKQVLDMGADGILIPMVSSAAEARAAVSACKYPPQGTRGFGPRRASDYGRNTDAYVAQANDSVIVIVQIEHINGVADIEGILDTPGIDVACLGPTDLSGSAGVLRQFQHPTVIDGMTSVIKAAKARQMPASIGITFPDSEMHKWYAAGANFIFCCDDVTLLATGAAETLANMRQVMSAR
ncbi:MAG TPA: aldolase/citrate lyase family protein [Rhizomicrobium sp.]|nr:aldolase/citrate lyase family protein [Rhizomicrobium sp.]